MKLEPRFSLTRVLLIGIAPVLLAAATNPQAVAVFGADPGVTVANPAACIQIRGSASSTASIGVTQVLPEGVPLASCVVSSTATQQRARWFLWSGLDSLIPLPNTLVLRNFAATSSGGGFGCSFPTTPFPDSIHITFDPPIVLVSVPQVAETLSTRLAVDVFSSSTAQSYNYGVAAQGLPGYLLSNSGLTTRAPLPGVSSSLAFTACRGADALLDLRVVQSVATTDTFSSGLGNERLLLQTFRVPQATDVRWVELAFGGPSGSALDTGTVVIVDPEGSTIPLLPLPGSVLTSGKMRSEVINPTPAWAPVTLTPRLGGAPSVLRPNHTYWLVANSYAPWVLHERKLSGRESPEFKHGVGHLFAWNGRPDGIWSRVPARALSFKLMGVPLSPAPSRTPNGSVGAPLR
jgi:hypothetical protein